MFIFPLQQATAVVRTHVSVRLMAIETEILWPKRA